ncbi:MAG: HupE/UreJ family protein [Arenicellales bacterium]|nr:HupE/UreJ family protein [Arenicellales bacterium]
MNKFVNSLFFTATLVVMVEPAAAHHAMGGTLPNTFGQGLLSGFGHPVIGIDHFAFILAVGLTAVFMPYRIFTPLIFVSATVLGCLLLVSGYTLPAVEIVIAASILLSGGLILSAHKLPPYFHSAFFFFAGLFHGYAYGESIVGAEDTPLFAYLLGFALVQYVIALATMWVVRALWTDVSFQAFKPRIAGAVIAGIGIAFLVENIEQALLV